GTPLATIKLVSTELIEELADRPDLRDDAQLIRESADRCRDILRSMGRAGKDDLHMRRAPLSALLREAAEPHVGRGKEVIFDLRGRDGWAGREPTVLRSPGVIHGLRNLIQNAVDFAKGRVWVDAEWSDARISVTIVDDGAGYPPHLLGRIGDPFLRQRKTVQDQVARPEYEGMGLGLFIAKTLLERSGAHLSFANAADPFLAPEERPQRCGAVVEVVWRAADLVAPQAGPLGPNTRNEA
ncbi:MAG: ATP-binding protein, partial [Paracoccaceae bacterium]|nr:ATP-binding protein [Paracoccaceae bacterium]